MFFMTSTRPYFVRAIYDWITDNGFTPHLLVDCKVKGVEVPVTSIDDNKIVLNIAHSATRNLEFGKQAISFNARFNGSPVDIFVPLDSVLAIYTKENGRGLVFGEPEIGEEEPQPIEQSGTPSIKTSVSTKSPNLSLVK